VSASARPLILAVVGLQREGKIVARDGVRVIAGGGDAAGLGRQIEAAIAEAGASLRGIVSTGVAGALDPTLAIGDCVIASGIGSSSGTTATDAVWRARLQDELPSARLGAIAGVDALSSDAPAKQKLRETSGAIAVDMESHIAARCAGAHGIAFAALRVISDRAGQALPPAARVAMRGDGGIDLAAIARSVATKPTQIPDLIRLGRDSGTALAALLRSLDALGLGFACPYLG
jgi:adenosylhomocysteine nucleosidase